MHGAGRPEFQDFTLGWARPAGWAEENRTRNGAAILSVVIPHINV